MPTGIQLLPAPPGRPVAALALGQFDGVHPGHRAVLEAAAALARDAGGAAAALTFSPPPDRILHPERPPEALATPEENRALLLACGIDAVALLPFTPDLATTPPGDFLALLVRAFPGLRALATGWNFTFGRGAAGNAENLPALAANHGLTVRVVPPVLHGGLPVASTRIRDALRDGDIPLAAALLGRPYAISGEVVRGRQVGRSIGFPTANLIPAPGILLPHPGVYVASVQTAPGAPSRRAAAFLPDPDDPRQQFAGGAVEVHIPDFEGDLYGRRLRLAFRRRLRGHHNFDTLEALATQLRRDMEIVRQTEEGIRQ